MDNIKHKGIIIAMGMWIVEKIWIAWSATVRIMYFDACRLFLRYLGRKKEAIEHPGNRKYGWNSRKGIIGIYKKVGYILTVLVAMCTDYLIYELSYKLDIKIGVNTLFGAIVCIWFILNEALSILENVG